jgi:ribokinase
MAGIMDVKYHGIVGEDGVWMVEYLRQLGFPTEHILVVPEVPSGNVVIQMQEHEDNENAVILHHGANFLFTEVMIRGILDEAHPGDYLLLQGETNLLDYVMQYALGRQLQVIFNPAPFPPKCKDWQRRYPCDWIVCNATEVATIIHGDCPNLGAESTLRSVMDITGAKNVIVTLGADGCRALIKRHDQFHYYTIPAAKVPTVDTTGAGDVFVGYFLAALLLGREFYNAPLEKKMDNVEFALTLGNSAAAIAVTRQGALDSVPKWKEVIASFSQ